MGNPVQSIYDSELLCTRETVLASAVVGCGRHHISNTIDLHEERHASALSTLNQFDGYDSRVNIKKNLACGISVSNLAAILLVSRQSPNVSG